MTRSASDRIASYMETSTNRPLPVCLASTTAASTPTAVSAAGKMSPMPGPIFMGGPSRSPVMCMTPPMAWATTSNAGRSRYGPAPVRASPKPRMAP